MKQLAHCVESIDGCQISMIYSLFQYLISFETNLMVEANENATKRNRRM